MSIDINQSLDIDILNQLPMYSYYYENVFSLEDLYLFRAVFWFYLGGSQTKAIADYEKCNDLKLDGEKKPSRGPHTGNDQESLMQYNQSGSTTPMMSMHSSKTDLSDVGLCSLNVHENNYNLLLCYLH